MDKEQETSGLVGGACYLLWLLAILLLILTGCVEHQVTAPQLDRLIEKVQLPPACPVPPPIPEHIRLIVDGNHVDADADGRAFLKAYVITRSCLRSAWEGAP